jgi:hypothetical protein
MMIQNESASAKHRLQKCLAEIHLDFFRIDNQLNLNPDGGELWSDFALKYCNLL